LRNNTWDNPLKCAEIIEYFTSHTLDCSGLNELKKLTRKDLEGIIHLLYGYYTHFAIESPQEIREALRCSAEDVIESMRIASKIDLDENGEIRIDDETWNIVKGSPQLLRYFVREHSSVIT
jgi:hypothetical protein